MLTSHLGRAALTALIVCTASGAVSQAFAAAPGARPGDAEMTCEAVSAERSQIEADVAKRAEAKAAGERRKQGFMAFAKGAASYAAPHVLGQIGGGSYMGSVAGQAVSQGAQAMANTQPEQNDSTASPPAATAEQQARLQRLTKIAAYRQCGV